MFFRFGIQRSVLSIEGVGGVGATAFPRQLVLLKKTIVLECFAPETHVARAIAPTEIAQIIGRRSGQQPNLVSVDKAARATLYHLSNFYSKIRIVGSLAKLAMGSKQQGHFPEPKANELWFLWLQGAISPMLPVSLH